MTAEDPPVARPGRRRGVLPFLGAGVALVTAAGLAPLTVTPRAGAAQAPAAASPFLLPSADVPAVTTGTGTIRFGWDAILKDAGAPIAQSSPTEATLGGTPSVVVGDRAGDVYAFDLTTGGMTAGSTSAKSLPGWPVQLGTAVTSTPSVPPGGGTVYVGAGNATDPTDGGYYAIGSSGGSPRWHTAVRNPSTDNAAAGGVVASMAVGTLQGRTGVAAGSLGQEVYALDASSGAALPGWPYPTTDSAFSTPALADLYGTGKTDVVEGGDQTGGFGYGQQFATGGHLRILNDRGGLVCHHDTNQTVDSSPAVGPVLAGGAAGIVTGTGAFFSGASDSDRLLAFDDHCNQVWSTQLDGDTLASPALADVTGTGQLDAVEVTSKGKTTPGTVYVVDAATGSVEWSVPTTAGVVGLASPVTADLTGQGYQDLLVPTVSGMDVVDGRTRQVVEVLAGSTPKGGVHGAGTIGFQNSALVTKDANGTIGITVAGYGGTGDNGYIEHFVVTPTPTGSATPVGTGSWPQFHDNRQLTGAVGTLAGTAQCDIPAAAAGGYAMVGSDGGIFSFDRPFCGSTGGSTLNAPIVGMATAPGTGGYWLVAADGGVFAYGAARFYGSMGGQPLNQPIVGMAATPEGKGYWLVASDGGIFAFGDAAFYGSMGGRPLNEPIVGIAASIDGRGYRMVAADGGIFAFGPSSQFFGSMGGRPLNEPIVGMADDVATGGYWLVASDGGMFAFNAPFDGSMGGRPLNEPIVGMSPTSSGQGYHLVASDGGIFSFGDAQFLGSMGGRPLNEPIVGTAGG
ncbi:MAG: PQQ-binding-like beta-propeller repeat protein [Acidimicrobiales bacterium]